MVKLGLRPPFQGDHCSIEILNSSSVNGIFFVSPKGMKIVVLWNPTIEKFKVILPKPVISHSNLSAMSFYHGFGYDRARMITR